MAETESKHTPGPWTCSNHSCAIWEIMNDDDVLAQVWSVTYSRDFPAEANARLIAAAPDLLAALKEIVESKAAFHGVANRLWTQAIAAIAKAEGES